MAYTRRHSRITQTEDLSATMRAAGRRCVVGRVLNLSERGMLVASSGFEVDEATGFELAGPGFRFAGVAKVTHRSDRAMGLRILSWQGQANRPICALIAARPRKQLESLNAGRRDARVLRRLVVFVGTQRAVERAPPRGRQPLS
jgi:hypothetical protein